MTRENKAGSFRQRFEASEISHKSIIATTLAVFVLGFFGVYRFYAGRWVSGILMILTFGGLGIRVLIDIILVITENFKDADGKRVVWPF